MAKKPPSPPEPADRPDAERIDEAVLALLYYNEMQAGGAWKSLPWEATDRLHEKGLISNPAKKAKSVWLTEEGLARGREAFRRLYERKEEGPASVGD